MNTNIRWLIVFLLFIATGLSFLDRQVLSIAIIKIQEEFHITDVQYGMINTSFLISYAIMFTLGGWLIDRVGGKRGLAISVGLWSVANSLHAVMTSFSQLLAFRFMLGIGEGGCFPGAAWTVYRWFDKKERALANGIAIGGSAIGAVVAPPLTIWLSGNYGWRGGFLIPGLIGIAWVIAWLLIPWRKENLAVNTSIKAAPTETVPFLDLLKKRPTWVFIIIRFLLDPVFYFMMFWIPKYLSSVRNVSFDQIGKLFWIPFLALGIANVLGGWFSGKLITHNFSVNRARKTVMGIAALLTLAAPAIEWVSSVHVAVALMSVFMFAHGFWITNYITSISDMFGQKATSTVVGLSGTAGAVSGLLLNPLMGIIIQNYSYRPLWVASGLLYPLAFGLLIWLIPTIKALNLGADQDEVIPNSIDVSL
ncbi:MFS transporter [Spirosoma endophyticum]|uniref:MFS transporter, ACS family, hexuronate transporter n=1 Tax=Spirosoma endophyticum TaxID=662367 RepID=A0A1I1R8P2_9BACT|nr:MFS transporter [Spirosoma endophyticum]SFD30679.1 MFS transporter, ACS family, hexuronate transporter [Spirosoma endophyticum]